MVDNASEKRRERAKSGPFLTLGGPNRNRYETGYTKKKVEVFTSTLLGL